MFIFALGVACTLDGLGILLGLGGASSDDDVSLSLLSSGGLARLNWISLKSRYLS